MRIACIAATVSAAFLFAGTGAYAQEKSAADHVAGFQPFIGQWVFQGPLQEDVGTIEKGTKLVFYNSFRWVARRKAVMFEWSARFEGTDPIESTEILLWDQKDKTIRCLAQASDGSQVTTDWTLEGDKLVGKVRGFDGDGSESSSTVHFTLTGKNSFTWCITDQKKAGKSIPDSSNYEFVRIR